MKRYIKNIAIMLGIILLELITVYTSAPVANIEISSYEDVLKILFDVNQYHLNFNILQFWFMSIYAVLLFSYLNLFRSMVLETPNYRSIKLYRYGKNRYLKHCMYKACLGNMSGVVIHIAGIWLCGIMLALQGNVVSMNGIQCLTIVTQLVKMFLVMELYGQITIFLLFRLNSSYAMCASLALLFIQLVLEIFANKIHMLTYSGIYDNATYILILVVLNGAVYLVIKQLIKRMSLC